MTPAQLLPIANVCAYLSLDDQANQTLLKGGFLRPQLPMLIDQGIEVVNWLNSQFPSDSTLQKKTNFLQWLCTPYIGRAQYILNQGGSGQIVNPATGVVSTLAEVFYQSTVGQADPIPLSNGQLSFVVPDEYVKNMSIQIVVDNGVIPYGIYSDRVSFTAQYSNSNVIINIYNGGQDVPENIGLQTGWVVQIRGEKFVSV